MRSKTAKNTDRQCMFIKSGLILNEPSPCLCEILSVAVGLTPVPMQHGHVRAIKPIVRGALAIVRHNFNEHVSSPANKGLDTELQPPSATKLLKFRPKCVT